MLFSQGMKGSSTTSALTLLAFPMAAQSLSSRLRFTWLGWFAAQIELLSAVSQQASVRRWRGANRRLHFHKRRQLFIGVHNETFSVVAMCISNPYYSPFASLNTDNLSPICHWTALTRHWQSSVISQGGRADFSPPSRIGASRLVRVAAGHMSAKKRSRKADSSASIRTAIDPVIGKAKAAIGEMSFLSDNKMSSEPFDFMHFKPPTRSQSTPVPPVGSNGKAT
jgi:hypothetical protein